jgi:hypothetical protein
MKLRLGAIVVFVAILASCSSSSSSSSLSAKDLDALEGAWARLKSVEAALNLYSRAVGSLFHEMEHPYGPTGRSAVRRATRALKVAERRAAAAAELPQSLEAEGLRVKESAEAMLAAWRRYVPRLKSVLAGHEKLSWDDGMIYVEEAQNALDQRLESVIYEVRLLSCEARSSEWESGDGYCIR